MANGIISSLQIGGGDIGVFTTPYGVCSTPAATATKEVQVNGDFILATGARVLVKFTITNSTSSPKLNVNETGAKAIYYKGDPISANYLAASKVYEFVYNGSKYDLIGDIDTDTTYTFNGAVSTIKNNNLTANKVLVSNSSGKVAASDVSSNNLNSLNNISSNNDSEFSIVDNDGNIILKVDKDGLKTVLNTTEVVTK